MPKGQHMMNVYNWSNGHLRPYIKCELSENIIALDKCETCNYFYLNKYTSWRGNEVEEPTCSSVQYPGRSQDRFIAQYKFAEKDREYRGV